MDLSLERDSGELWTSYLYRLLEKEKITVSLYISAGVGFSRFQADAHSTARFKEHSFPLDLYLQREIRNADYHQRGSALYCCLEDISLETIPLYESVSINLCHGATSATFDFERTVGRCRELIGPLWPGPTDVFAAYRIGEEYPAERVVGEFVGIMTGRRK